MRHLNLIDKAFFLKTTTLLSDLDLDLLLAIADCLDLMGLRAQDYVFQAKQEANQIYFILSGNVQVLDENSEILCQLKTGDYFGDEALFNRSGRGYSTLCSTASEFLTLSRSNFLKTINECPIVALTLLEAYSKNILFRQR